MRKDSISTSCRWLASLALIAPLLGATAVAQTANIKNGLKAYWNFENNFEDQVGIFDGTENGSEAIPFVDGRPGFGKAIRLNGEDQYVEVTGGEPDDLAMAGGSISIAGWFKVDAFDTSWQALVAKGEGSNWRVARRSAENGIAYAGGLTDTPTGTDVNDGNWHHFVAISDSEGAQFGTAVYIDGKLDTIIEGAAALVANGSRVMIGENPGARGREWEGYIDDVAIWDRVLNQSEIDQLWNNGAGRTISEILGAVPGDADGDGMPDAYEIEKGFNPNDPSDAAKDFDGDGVSNLDEYKAGTDPIDVTKPTVVSVAGTPGLNSVLVTFSEEVDPATATVPGNYTITPALAVTSVTYNRRVATLTTAAQTAGATAYTVEVKGVRDTSKNEVAAGTTATFYSYLLTTTGVIKISYWTNITGTPVQNLYDDPRYPASPDGIGTLYSFNSRDFFPGDSLENYGAVMEGILTPTESGNYRFFIYSDDASELYLSTDATEANLNIIAEETGCCNFFTEPDSPRTSEPIALTAGQRYYIRLVYKEGGGGDYGQVAWRREGDPTPAGSLAPIPGRFLSSTTQLPYPPDGVFLTQSPAANAKNVSPYAGIRIVHTDGKTPWTAENVTLKFDGAPVTPTFNKSGSEVTITYQPPSGLGSLSSHTVSLGYLDAGGQPVTREWSFEVTEYKGPVVDKVSGYPAILVGAAKQTDNRGGRTGADGDYAYDSGVSAGAGLVNNATWLNAATADDTLTISFFQKLRSVRNSSSFWANSASSNNGTRGFQAHVPWGDSNIYYDTSGCCDADIQRIFANIDTYGNYTGDATWWQSWHHLAFVKDGNAKRIYIDGNLFLEGAGAPLKTDFTSLLFGAGPSITENRMDGLLDDFTVHNGALTEAQVKSLSGGAAPSSVTGLIAHWDFNDQVAATVTLKVARSGNQVTISSEPAALPAGWVLQTAPSVRGPWTSLPATTTLPATVDIGTTDTFLRATRP